jgi:hypothetical protein
VEDGDYSSLKAALHGEKVSTLEIPDPEEEEPQDSEPGDDEPVIVGGEPPYGPNPQGGLAEEIGQDFDDPSADDEVSSDTVSLETDSSSTEQSTVPPKRPP